MSKLLYTFLILPLFLNTLHAYYWNGEEERWGQVFSSHTFVEKKKKGGGGHIRWSSIEPTLTAATVRHLNNQALLHFKSFEIMFSGERVFSHTVTSNPTGLTKKSTTFEGLPQDAYASIPIQYGKHSGEIKLGISEMPFATKKDDYAQTIASSLELLLTEFIPLLFKINNRLPTTVSITNGSPALQEICFSERFREILSSKYTIASTLPIQPHVNDCWTLTLNFNQPPF